MKFEGPDCRFQEVVQHGTQSFPCRISCLGDTEASSLQGFEHIGHLPREVNPIFHSAGTGTQPALNEKGGWSTARTRCQGQVDRGHCKAFDDYLLHCVLPRRRESCGLYLTHFSSCGSCCQPCTRCWFGGALSITRCRVWRGLLHIRALDKMGLHSSTRPHWIIVIR